jgi:polysaccharide pyruvyl transferase CsaB
MPRRLLLGGYFGSGNLGDDAILLGLLEGLAGRGHDVTVLSGNPEETSRLYGVRTVQRRNLRLVRETIAGHDALVYGGGSLFQDSTSIRSVLYYHGLVAWAKKAGKKVALVGQGVGPVRSFLGRRLTARAFGLADAVAVRDPASAALLRELGVPAAPVVAADPAFLLPKPRQAGDVGGFQVGEMRTIGIAPRQWGKGGMGPVASLIADFCRMVFQSNMMPVLVEMDRHEDATTIQEIEARLGGKAPAIQKVPTPTQLQERLARMDAVLAVRLHAGVLAANVGVPSMMLSYDPKVAAFAKEFDLPCHANLGVLTAQRLFDDFGAMLKDRPKLVQRLEAKLPEARRSARQNIVVIERCLGA